MSRLVAVVGPEATGKSTLARALADALGLAVLADSRLTVLKRTGYHTLYEAARARPVWRELLEEQLAREAAAAEAVIDTPVLDCWVLWQRWGWCSATPATTERLYAAVGAAAARYSHVVVMPGRQVGSGAGYRFVDPDHAAQVSRLTRAAVAELAGGAPALYLEPGDASALFASAAAFVR